MDRTEDLLLDREVKLFAMSAIIKRTNGAATTTRNLLGWRRCESIDAAVGSFVVAVLGDVENEGFSISEILRMEIPE